MKSFMHINLIISFMFMLKANIGYNEMSIAMLLLNVLILKQYDRTKPRNQKKYNGHVLVVIV